MEDRREGIFAILDEECVVPQATEASFCLKVHTKHSAHPYLSAPKPSRKARGKRYKKEEAFVVKHFAGEVTYAVDGILDRNNDALHADLEALVVNSDNAFVRGYVSSAGGNQEGGGLYGCQWL